MQKLYPFKFLDAYEAQDKDIFFGRENEIKELYEMAFQSNLLVVYGGSGTGKTSLIQCGLASKFQSYDWFPISIRRGANLNESLEKSLAQAGGTEAGLDDWEWTDEEAGQTKPAQPTLSPLAQQVRNVYTKQLRPIYLIFDQFEELYILGSAKEQRLFVQGIKAILQVEQPVKIIFSVREEYLGHLYEFEKEVPALLRKKIRIEAMNLDRVRNVLQGIHQLKNSQIRLEKGKEQEIIDLIFSKIKGKETTLTIQLPYLQVFLDKLYLRITKDETRKADAVFSLVELEKMGDIGNVLQDFLEEQALQIAEILQTKPETVWKMLSPFVTLDGTKEPLNPAKLAQRLPEIDQNLLKNAVKTFTDRRIVRYNEHNEMYEIAHDSLAKQIASKRTDEEIAILEVQRLIKTQSEAKTADKEYFTEKQLNFIEPYLSKIALEPAQAEWIAASKTHVEAQKEAIQKRQAEELRKAKRQLRKVMVLAGFVAFAFIWALFAQYQANRETEKANNATKEAKASEKNATLQKEKAQKALIISYQAKIKEWESVKSVLESDKNLTEAQKYQQQIDSLQKLIKELQ